jgi:predicted ATPase
VGRDAEVEHLRRVLGQAGAGHGQVAAIVGEAGVGKSRLTYEFTHSHRVQDWLILEASSVSYGKATSYLPVIDLLKGYFKIGDRDNHREMRDKVMGRVLGLDRALEPLLPPLLALIDVPVEDAAWQTLDAPQRRQRTLDAVKRLLLRESQVQPLLVVFEDLHWIDGETQALLDSLLDSLGSARLLLLVNYRPEYQHGWGSKTAYSQMRLDALPAESAGELLEALLGDDRGLAPLERLLVKRGNPFFLEETVRMLVETKTLEGSRGQYRLTLPLQALQVPPTVQTILAARIDRLSPDDKRLLQTAAVAGKDVPFALLQAIAELPDEALRAGLDRLRIAEFIYESGLFPDLEYAFKHALTHEVTYGTLLQERRRILHAHLVGAIERLHADRLGEQIERLAHHALRGEVWEKAVAYLRQAGLRAMARGANREAIAHLEQALGALRRLPETRETTELTIDIRLDLRTALLPLGNRARMGDHLHEAEVLPGGSATSTGSRGSPPSW